MAMTAEELSKQLEKGVETFQEKLKEFHTDLVQKYAAMEDRMKMIEEERVETTKENIMQKIGGKSEIPADKFSFARCMLAVAAKDWTYAPFEKSEIDKHRDYVKKTMEASTFTAGGSVIPPQYVAELIELLRPKLIVSSLGVRTLTGLSGSPVMIPKQTGGATYYWIAPEGTAITASDLTTGQQQYQPHKIAALVKISNDLNLLSNPAVEAMVRESIASDLAEGMDTAFFQGTGVSGQPVGLENVTPAIPTESYVTTDGESKINSFKDALKKLENNNGLQGNLKFAMNPTSYWNLEKLADANKRHYLQPDPASPDKGRLLGYQIERSTLVSTAAASNVWFGNWSDAIQLTWSQLEFAASTETETAFAQDQLWIRAIARTDHGVTREKSFVEVPTVTS